MERSRRGRNRWLVYCGRRPGLKFVAELGKRTASANTTSNTEIAIGETPYHRHHHHHHHRQSLIMADFLSCCYLCSKNLQGKDIYMFRGDKAFCSDECRQRHMACVAVEEDEPDDTSSTSTDQMPAYSGTSCHFFAGVVAA